MVIFATILSIVLMIFYVVDLIKNAKFNVKNIVMIGMFSAMSFVLYLIEFIKYPQGGGISLFSMMPTMILALLYGRQAGLTGGAIFGLLKLLNGATIVHPAQFILDYLLGGMALGLAGTFGREKKSNVIAGCLFAAGLSVLSMVVSGAVFFGQYAPAGMNVWLYSLIYNLSSAGVEGLLTTVLVTAMPLKRLEKAAKVN
ncbi:energy-coupled thiamine transporter ThiT [Clostridium ihumii]|uniref:energy-coupled thiamine transporter ThiT n=1 Tax=Clostridium ihumii TaxID=1470356 RepID=UPI00058E4455|nr:energy-coupled thiamine transporter ThiT [Clostridium ihumii]